MKYRTLYDIGQELSEIDDLLDSEDLDQPDPSSMLRDFIERLREEGGERANQIGGLIKYYEGLASKAKEEKERLAHRQKVYENKAGRYKEEIRRFLEEEVDHGRSKTIDTGKFRFTLSQKGGAAGVNVTIDDPEDLPEEYKRTKTTVTPDKTRLREDLESDDEDTKKHASKYAELEEKGTYVRIS